MHAELAPAFRAERHKKRPEDRLRELLKPPTSSLTMHVVHECSSVARGSIHTLVDELRCCRAGTFAVEQRVGIKHGAREVVDRSLAVRIDLDETNDPIQLGARVAVDQIAWPRRRLLPASHGGGA